MVSRDHPVGNMMRHALPLHDLSRIEVTVLLIHEQQEHAAQQAENKHLLGDVRLVMLGRGPGVSQLWDPLAAQRGAHLVNRLGVGILVDLEFDNRVAALPKDKLDAGLGARVVPSSSRSTACGSAVFSLEARSDPFAWTRRTCTWGGPLTCKVRELGM